MSPAPGGHWAGIEALLVDFDGVIIDSEYAHYQAWRDAFRTHGLWLSTDAWADHWAVRDHNSKSPITAMMEKRLGAPLEDADGLIRDVRQHYRALVAALPARRGIEGWLREAAAHQVRCAVVTDGRADHVHAVLDRLQLTGLVEAVIGREGSRARKPAPDTYRTALDHLGVAAEQAVAIEDSPHGIAASRAAGVRCLAAPHKITNHLLQPGPGTVVIDPVTMSLDRALALLARPRHTARAPRHGGEDVLRRIRASLTGLALGDALGKVIDKRATAHLDPETHALLDALADGGPPPDLFRGRITDDTVLTLAFARAITATGTVSRAALEDELRAVNPNGGRQIYKLKAAAGPVHVAEDGDTNGCVPRSATLGYLYGPDEVGDLSYDVLKTATLTHAHPDAVMAALVFAIAVSHAVTSDSPRDALHTIRTALPHLVRLAGGGRTVAEAVVEHTARCKGSTSASALADHLEQAVGMGVKARSSSVAGIVLGMSGLVPQDLLPHLFRRQTQGDLDSVAAVYGALAGAFHPETIPAAWGAVVEQYNDISFTDIARRLHQVRAAASR
ncbi:HAD-IA family hydrolase [Streptomyces celluloflavus]|uniref:HAD-IA family hydrolase n=1 Tax=Streptomyces celluloflavus TaxID=58344 RepID=UPI00345FFA13|nr:HAD-IA family hydrolase [Streptomyces celluloflavus]